MEKIVLGMCWNEKGEEHLYLDGDRSRSHGILRFGHEFSVTLTKALEFVGAYSIDCGEANRYRTEEEFEWAYPGVMGAIRQAHEEGRLYMEVGKWNEAEHHWDYEEVPC